MCDEIIGEEEVRVITGSPSDSVVEIGAPDSTESVRDKCSKEEVEEDAEFKESADVMGNGDE